MSVHQIITGALNQGESVFSVGMIEGINFTACAVGCDVVILDCEFKRVQIVPGSSTGFVQVTSIAACIESGKIAVAFYDFIRIYKPLPVSDANICSTSQKLNYRWFEASAFSVQSFVTCLSWNLDGFRLLVSTETELRMYQHRALTEYCSVIDGDDKNAQNGVTFGIDDESLPATEEPSQVASVGASSWSCVWSTKLQGPLRQVKFSPDGSLFATCRKGDNNLTIWFCDSMDSRRNSTKLSYNFICLKHPKEVIGFEWRKSGRYIFRGFVANVVLTWCQDHISRIWCETSPVSDCEWGQSYRTTDSVAHAGSLATDSSSPDPGTKDASRKLLQRLKQLKRKKKVKQGSRNVPNQPTSLAVFPDTLNTGSEELHGFIHFHLSASINAKTDCLLVPSVERCMADTTMAIHWLNNKELVFSQGAERLISEALVMETVGQVPVSGTARLASMPESKGASTVDMKPADNEVSSHLIPPSNAASAQFQLKDSIDMKFEALLRNWQHSYDVLFAIHPSDGSLLVWTAEYLDCVTRQAQVSFASRLPNAFPISDAASLHHNLGLLSSRWQTYWDTAHKDNGKHVTLEKSPREPSSSKVYLLTTHQNGTLNLWHLNVDEKSKYSLILGITHKSRMCGHRFMVKHVACHPMLPLFLTVSHHNVRRKKFELDQDEKQQMAPSKSEVQLFGSELILWQVVPVGPLQKSGGVYELSRINSPELSAFSSVAWIPSVLPSSTLGRSSNSASSCFIASDGHCLRVYQAVLDARSLLSDMNYAKQFLPDTRSSSSDTDNFEQLHRRHSIDVVMNIISTQSTARPGCIIGLDPISEAIHHWRHVQMMHVFHEGIMLASVHGHNAFTKPNKTKLASLNLDRSKETTFHDRFYLVLLEKSKNPAVAAPTVHTWLVGLYSQSALDGEPFEDGETSSQVRKVYADSANLNIYSKKVGSQTLSLPEGVRVIDCCPSVSHLSSSSIYPSCHAPYLLSTACSDDRVRFWRCDVDFSQNPWKYEWVEWRMSGEVGVSDIEVEGTALRVSSAYSGRIACAFDPGGTEPRAEEVSSVDVNVIVYECESSGAIEWVEEDLIRLHKIPIQHLTYFPSESEAFSLLWADPTDTALSMADKLPGSFAKRIPSVTNVSGAGKTGVRSCYVPGKGKSDIRLRLRDMVRLAWVSSEDGSHILTVGVGSLILLYAPVAEDVAQHYVALMKETDQSNLKRRRLLHRASTVAAQVKKMVRWVCLRCAELESADGLPPLPRMLCWVRHGIMVVGLDTEMRIYSQWDMSKPEVLQKRTGISLTRIEEDSSTQASKGLVVPQQHLATTHSILDSLRKNKKNESSSNLQRRLNLKKQEGAEKIDNWNERLIVMAACEGLFEAARVAMSLLPQYHPRQLLELLRAGKTRMAKAILLNMLRKLIQYGSTKIDKRSSLSEGSEISDRASSRRPSFSTMEIGRMSVEQAPSEYFEVDQILPLPLYTLVSPGLGESEKSKGTAIDSAQNANDLIWSSSYQPGGLNLSTVDMDAEGSTSEEEPGEFTAKEAMQLSHLLTHVHLPGLTSVDQLHLLAIADVLSSFSDDDVEERPWFSSGMTQPGVYSRINVDNRGYATGSSAANVDVCGVRYLMAVRHYEYLLRCSPLQYRALLRSSGLPSANLIWALHSDTEMEILDSLSCMQRNKPSWDELRSLGAGWWLKSISSLRICFERVAKSAFQVKNDPMDAALFYLAMKKKSVLTHLFKTVRDTKMTEFFSNDFTQEKWKKAALKNAFALISKQRFDHAVAFFLLGDAMDDAIKVCLDTMNDIQLALIIVRLCSNDEETSEKRLQNLLRTHVLFCSEDDDFSDPETLVRCPDPFLRSIAFWYLKEYSLAASTLLHETNLRARSDLISEKFSSSDVFNFYVYLRNHPLVLRKRLEDNGVQVTSTEQFVKIAQQLSRQVSATERKLFFSTAFTHLQCGCPLLAVEVLSKLPRPLPSTDAVPLLKEGSFRDQGIRKRSYFASEKPVASESTIPDSPEDADWTLGGQLVDANHLSSRIAARDELQLDWDDEDGDEKQSVHSDRDEATKSSEASAEPGDGDELDVIAQTLKFIACLKLLTEELASVVSGYEVDGGQLRAELYLWLERNIEMLKVLCDYKTDEHELNDEDVETVDNFSLDVSSNQNAHMAAGLHEALRKDRAQLSIRLQRALRMRRWLSAHQQVIRSLTYFCYLHSSASVGLASASIELLLLLQELNQNLSLSRSQLTSRLPIFGTFPLMSASLSSVKSDIALPLRYLINQTSDVLKTLAEMDSPPKFQEHLSRVYLLYNLSQCLSACIYGSLCDMSNVTVPNVHLCENSFLLHQIQRDTGGDNQMPEVVTTPDKWPGVDGLLNALSGDRDEDVPNLLILLVESWVAIYMSLFAFCLCTYDSRWLYRLVAHPVNDNLFSTIFGGGGQRHMLVDVQSRRRSSSAMSTERQDSIGQQEGFAEPLDSMKLRARLHSKVFGHHGSLPQSTSPAMEGSNLVMTSRMEWVQPRKSIIAFYMAKPSTSDVDVEQFDYDSEEMCSDEEEEEEEEEEKEKNEDSNEQNEKVESVRSKEHSDPNSYSWAVLRLALARQAQHRIRQFLAIAGLELNEMGGISSLIYGCLNALDNWIRELSDDVENYPGGCPDDFLPSSNAASAESLGPSLHRYRAILEPNNTPFYSDQRSAQPVRRLWLFLVRQEHLMDVFIRSIFKAKNITDKTTHGSMVSYSHSEAFKVIQREHDPISAFAICPNRFGLVVVSSGRELQEMDISQLLSSKTDWMHDPSDLEMLMVGMKKNLLVDNDDYLLVDSQDKSGTLVTGRGTTYLCKRVVPGVRRMEAHPTMPYYLSGSTDGSVRLWEWGVGQPRYTPRVSGKFAKVTQTRFSAQGNKFGIADADGWLALWYLSSGATTLKKPYFTTRCHSKTCTDFIFLGQSSSLLASTGQNTNMDSTVVLWDTLLPPDKSNVHSWTSHADSSTCLAYCPTQQCLLSGNKHGEVFFWDVRQRQLRQTLKAFDNSAVRSLAVDPMLVYFSVGSADGDIKVYTISPSPQLAFHFPGEHASRSTFSLRQVGSTQVQGVQMMYIDSQLCLYSCGADCSFKLRQLFTST